MKCEKLEPLWIPYLDGELSGTDRALVESHLAECSACEARREGLAEVSLTLNAWTVPEPSPWFDARLRRRIIEEAASAPVSSWFGALAPRFPLGMAALLLLAALLLTVGGPNQAIAPREVVFNDPQKMDELIHVVEEVELLRDAEFLAELEESRAPVVRQ